MFGVSVESCGEQESLLSLFNDYNDYLNMLFINLTIKIMLNSNLIQSNLQLFYSFFNQFYLQSTIEDMDKPQAKTPGEQLRNQYTRDLYVSQNHTDDDYINKLKKLGLQSHKAIFPAFFKLKNGLPYPGMATNQKIENDEVLVKVPQQLILSAMKALKQPELSLVFENSYYKDEVTWQDRVLLTYCLFLISKNATENIFYDMVQHMPKDIDVLFFWSENEQDLFIDKTVKSAALLDMKSFQQQWNQFKEIQTKYEILRAPEFNYENFKWIFIHISSRCFGKAMDYTSFVPFCQLFNHHSSNVYYEINQIQNKVQQQQKEQEELSSNGSYSSQQYIQVGDYSYDEIETVTYKWGQKEHFDLDKKQKKQIRQFTVKLLQRVQVELNWLDFSIIFAGHFITRVKMVQNQFIEGRKRYDETMKTFTSLQTILQKYIVYVKVFYQQKYNKKYKYEVKTRENLQKNKGKTPFVRPDDKNYKATYSEFYLKTGKNDKFLENNQIYFCYGKNSNRTLLLRYGFAIQGNKYEHFYLVYPLSDILKQFPDLLHRIEKLGLSVRRKYKINCTRLNIDLIIFFRLNSWNLYGIGSLDQIFYVMNIPQEIAILQQIIFSLQVYLEQYENEKEEDLVKKQLTYHEYFIKVYNMSKKRILIRQIQLFQKLTTILTKLEGGEPMESACQELTQAEKYMFSKYLDTIVL